MTQNNSTIHFNTPPINEVYAGVQFEDLIKFVPWQIDLWSLFGKNNFPETDYLPRMPKLGDQRQLIVSSRADVPRIRFKSKEYLLQIQNDRFVYNWLKVKNHNYPRYSKFIEEFYKNFEIFRDGIENSEAGILIPQMLELNYINVVPFDDFESLDKLSTVTKLLNIDVGGKFLKEPNQIAFNVAYHATEMKALHKITIASAQNMHTGKSAIRIDQSLHGQSPSNSFDDEVKEWFDKAHTRITNAFVEMTSSAMLEKWGYKS